MVEFFTQIIDVEKLSKVSVDNYRILLEAVFNFVRKDKNRKLLPNPVFELPGTKRVNDSAAYPIQELDIPILKRVIQKEDPQLWLAICFEYYCFLRPRKEIRFIRIGDIDFGRSMVRIREVKAKNNGRIVTIPDSFMLVLRNQLQHYPREYFVFGKNGKPGMDHLSYNNLGNRFLAIRRKLHMPEEYKLYSWKHTGNVRADVAGIPRREIQEQNGHTTIQTTEIYMRNKRGYTCANIKASFPEL
jgi:integrase